MRGSCATKRAEGLETRQDHWTVQLQVLVAADDLVVVLVRVVKAGRLALARVTRYDRRNS